MLTKLIIRNFKRFEEVEIDLGNPVVFIGPNNSGKTTALQALSLWYVGLRSWLAERKGKAPEKRPGVAINRRDLIAAPVPRANLLWRDLHTRNVRRENGKKTDNVRIEIVVEGVGGGTAWRCGLEFDYANAESIYCRPLRADSNNAEDRIPVPAEAAAVRVALLPPMSGLAANETRLEPGAIDVRLGEGRTAEVLRNLCHAVHARNEAGAWNLLVERIRSLFGVSLRPPEFIVERGEITMEYEDEDGIVLDLSSSGRGLQQTLLLLSYMTVNRGAVVLLDEPDAHLEILRQRQIYQMLSEAARTEGSQIIAASHSEVLLNEAADRDTVVAFVGRPHRIDDRGSQTLKALKQIGFDQYYQAEQTGWVLYLEGSTDLAILRAFAAVLDHPAAACLQRPFVHYVENKPLSAREHFFGLLDAKPNLVGLALFDRLSSGSLRQHPVLLEVMWKRREIENYLCTRATLLAWAGAAGTERDGELFGIPWKQTMEAAIQKIEAATTALRKPSPWSSDAKVTDDFLDPLFRDFFERLKLPNLLSKTDYHVLAPFVPPGELDAEVAQVLDMIEATASRATPTR